MARTANPDPAPRRALLKAGTRLMLARGFAATSVDDVCRETGVTKGSLFHYFDTKEALGAAVLDEYLARVFAKLDEVRAASKDPLARLVASLRFLADAAQVYPLREGCLLGRFSQELAETHPRIRGQCARAFDRFRGAVALDLRAAAKQRGLRIDAASLAEYVLAVFEGAVVLARASGD